MKTTTQKVTEISEQSEFENTILNTLKDFPILVVIETKNKNKVNIGTVIKFSNLFINKIIMENVGRKLAESIIDKHNSKL